MSKIFDLINELCPDGVEFMEVEEVFIMKNGYTPSKANKDFWENGTIPWYRMEDIRENGRILSESIQKITPKAVKGGKLIPKNSIIVATTATIGEHALAIADSFLMNQQFTSFTIRELLKDKLDIEFVFYYFFKICEWCKQNTNSSSFPSVDMAKLKKVKFPVPPMEVQREIVRILDSFTLLTAELTAELTARKKQYEFYRDFLLSFDELDKNGGGCELKMLGEICELIRGNGLQKKDFVESGVPAIHYGQIYTYYGTFASKTKSFVSVDTARNLKKVNFGDVVITNTSENLQDVGKAVVYLGKEQAVTGGHATILKPKNTLLGKFFVYLSQTAYFYNEKVKYAKGTKVIDVSASDMSKILIPVPSLQTQQKVVDILDKFDTLVNSITEGLPREIELRRKQYEHYRELLLNFKPKMRA
ncbi:restriction endonuclease subunit S [Campylobacter concisus]|uniref:restriction endonuclease subunit S n=1 Tax=Campylobacter concisus TaxID=199 RepID=UPI0011E724B1|nr:restriction endonuclease subunit S [Campylobacter concisus]